MTDTSPHSPETERAIIGCALMNHAEIYSDVEAIREQDFFIPAHRIAWGAIKSLAARGCQIHLAAFLDEIRALGSMSAFEGGEMWASTCAMESPIPQSIGSYVSSLKRFSTLRRIIAMCTEASARAHGTGDLDAIVETMRSEIAAIEVDSDDVGPVRIIDAIDPAIKAIADRNAMGKAKMGFGIERIDERTGGLRPRQMSVIGGLPGMGKTADALSVAARNVAIGIPVLIFSLEMTIQDLIERVLSMKSRVACYKLITGKAKGDTLEWDRVNKAGKDIAFHPMWIDDRTQTCNQICGEIHRWYAKHVRKMAKPGEGLPEALVIIDYLGQISSEERSENRNREIAKMVHRLKATAKSKTMNIHVSVLSQLSNEAAKRGGFPQASDLRDSGEIWAAADLVVFPWRDKQAELLFRPKPGDEPFRALHIIDKNKSGMVGNVEVFWSRETMTYEGIEEWGKENR